jgi:hypothetical protein
VAHARTVVLVALALATSSGVAGAAPAVSEDRIDLLIGQAADLQVIEVAFDVPTCTKKPYCSLVAEIIDFFGGDDCGKKSAQVPLPVAECSFRVNDRILEPFDAEQGEVFVAPATGVLSCVSPETLSAPWVEWAEAYAEADGYQCDGDGDAVPEPTYEVNVIFARRTQ